MIPVEKDFFAMKDAILSRVVGRAKAALEVGIEDQETDRQGRTAPHWR